MNDKNESKSWVRTSTTFKFLIVGALILILLIPAEMIKSLIKERNALRNSVIDEVSYKWGNPQTLAGPLLTIPYKQYFRKDNKIIEEVHYAHFLPENLEINGDVNPEIRYRGIYKVVVYSSNLEFKGNFRKPDFSQWKINESDILWDDAYLSVRVPDMRGIRDIVKVNWNKEVYDVNPGINQQNYSGISSQVKIGDSEQYDFSYNLNLNGSSSLNFIPLGKETNIAIASPWTNPSFDGAFLPYEREVNEKGFNAKWKVLHLNRTFHNNGPMILIILMILLLGWGSFFLLTITRNLYALPNMLLCLFR